MAAFQNILVGGDVGRFPLQKTWVTVLIGALVLLPASLLLTMSGCGQSGSSASSSSKAFAYSELADPPTLDPALVNEGAGVNIDRYVFEGLVSYDSQTGEAKPAVARSWDVNSNATEFTFHLNKGLKFSDGQEVTAADFTYAWTRALEPATASPTAPEVLGQIKGAEDVAQGKTKTLAGVSAPDKYTLKVTLVSPMSEFPAMLGHPVASPVPQKEVERAGSKFADAPVGDGPFVVKEWQHNDHILLEKNPQYAGTRKPKVDKVTVKIIPSATTAVAELKAGNIDAVKDVDPAQVASLKKDSKVKYIQKNTSSVELIGFNIKEAPFDNTKLRQAISQLIDRKTIADKVVQGQSYPADGFIPTSVFGYQGGVLTGYDFSKGASMLASAGYPGGKGLPALTLSYPSQGPNTADIVQAVQSELKAAGVQVNLQQMDGNAFLDAMQSGKLGMFMVSWQADYPGIDGFLQPLFESDNIGATNVFNYSNPDVDKLIQKALATTNAGQRNKTFTDAEKQIVSDMPAIPVVFGKNALVYAPRVTNFVYTPMGDIALDQVNVSD